MNTEYARFVFSAKLHNTLYFKCLKIFSIKSIAKNVFLKATNREPVCTIVSVHVSCTAIEVEVACISTTYCTRPIVAVSTYVSKRTSSTIAVACKRQKKNTNLYFKLQYICMLNDCYTTLSLLLNNKGCVRITKHSY